MSPRPRSLHTAFILLVACLGPLAFTPATSAQTDPLHIWVGKLDRPAAEKWVNAHLAQEQKEIDALLAVKGPRTVENTLQPYDNSQNELAVAGQEAYLMYAVAPQKEVRDAGQALAEKVQQAATILSLNQDVYRALVVVNLSSADAATKHYMDRALLEYRLAGVDKDAATRAQIKKLFDRATELGLAFGRNIQENVNRVAVKSKAELSGLPADFIAAHPPAADGSITLTTEEPDEDPVMNYAASDDLRKRMYLAYNTRAYPKNKDILLDLLKTRAELAKVLGYGTWADFATADQMIGSAGNMKSFLNDVDVASRDAAKREYSLLLAFARQKQPDLAAVPAYGSFYLYEQYGRSTFGFDSQAVRPYFPYDRVQQGILDTAARLFHVVFKPATDAAVWDPSVSAWNVFDGDKLAGRVYFDMHPRDGKDKWFSSSPVVPGVKGKQLPEGALVCNFPGGKPGDPGLLQYDDVVIFFHEFGHLMHNILGGQQAWSGVSGFATESDFVEAPSQMLEEFFHDPAILQSFAKHYQTNEVLPLDLIEKMNRASAFGRARWVQGQLFYSSYSLDLHDRSPEGLDLDAILRTDFGRFIPYPFVEGNHMYAAFGHLVGYTSNYYTYLLDKIIALDFFAQFDQKSLLDGEAAMRYRRMVLEPGGSKPGAELISGFLGRPQNLDAFKTWMGEEFRDAAK
ncbi:MAG TPA: M3 family metallopeptidase [Terriglobales bacterium]|jgi:thimet oligopeptidase|nr:M3 family metallopeptidase [Terriglobales bacterium]